MLLSHVYKFAKNTELTNNMENMMIRALINKEDHSLAFLEQENNPIHSSALKEPSLILVEIDQSCLTGIDPEDYPNLFWDSETNMLYIHPEVASLSTPTGRQRLREQLQGTALIPPESRTQEQELVVQLAWSFLPESEVEQILQDDVLEDTEIQAILGALDENTTT